VFLTFLLKTSSFMPFFNGDASVIMGALKNKPPYPFTPALIGNRIEYPLFRARATSGHGTGTGPSVPRRRRGDLPQRLRIT